MEKFKGTKGEWSIDKNPQYDHDIICDGGIICSFTFSDYKYEIEANAKLIAAAPEMLEMLIDLLEQDQLVSQSAQDSVIELIKKATE